LHCGEAAEVEGCCMEPYMTSHRKLPREKFQLRTGNRGARTKGYGMNYLPLNLFKCLSLLRAPFKIILLPGHVVQRTYNLAVIWDMPPPKTHST